VKLVRPALMPCLLWLGRLVLRLIGSVFITSSDIHLDESTKVS
jgi:hypothetical protein